MKWNIQKSYWQQDIKPQEYLAALGKGIILIAGIAYLFYHSLLLFILLSPLLLFYMKEWKRNCIRQKQQAFQLQFKEALQGLSAALNAGYSVENAMRETYKDLHLLYDDRTRIMKEFSYMIHQLNMNIPAEQILKEFAGRTKQEDVSNLVTVFVTAKRSGGDIVAVLKHTVMQIADKVEVKKEIQTMLSAKRLEFQVMSGIPFGIITYMRLSFPEFMEVLYGNAIGVATMSVCLGIYVAAYQFGKKIIEVEV